MNLDSFKELARFCRPESGFVLSREEALAVIAKVERLIRDSLHAADCLDKAFEHDSVGAPTGASEAVRKAVADLQTKEET